MGMLGFIGLGIMGKPMAKNLRKAGFDLLVYDVNETVVKELVAEGAKAATPAEIGAACDTVLTILPSGPIVREVLFGENGVAASLGKGAVVMDMSSVTPEDSKACAEGLAPLGIAFLDAPVSGGEPKAIDGTLSFMVGGDEAAYEKMKPYIDAMGASSILVGGTGSGSTTKLVNQIIVNLTIAAVAEGFVLAAKAGVDPEKVYQAIRGGLAGSTVLDAKVPMMMNRNFEPGGKISINHKDIRNVLQSAHALDVPVPMSSQLFEIMQTLKVHGYMDADHSAYVRYFEMLADVEVRTCIHQPK